MSPDDYALYVIPQLCFPSPAAGCRWDWGDSEPEGRGPNDGMEQSAPQTHTGLRPLDKQTLSSEAIETRELRATLVYSDLNSHVPAAGVESPVDN